jgi:non-specific serine/threonine protein kinase
VGLGEHIYAGTGLTIRAGAFSSISEFFRFDPAAGTYESLPDVPQRLDHAAFVAYKDAIYVIGGYADTRPLADVWRYSVGTGEWNALAPMRIARGSPAAAMVGDKIYVAGGSRDEQGARTGALSSVEVYDISTGNWSAAPEMPTPRHHHGAAVLDGRLVVVGGRNDDDLSLDVVEQFDPASGRWTRLPSLPAGAGGVSVVTTGGRIVAIGGGDDEEAWVTPATWALDPAGDEWRRLADLNVARHGHGAAVVGQDVYVFAGAPCPGYGRTDAVELLQTTTAQSSG